MSAKRRIHLQLPLDMERDVREVGRERGIGLGPAIRVLVRLGLQNGNSAQACRDCSAAVAGLVAAEHTLLVVASILPQGRNLIAGLATEAAKAAEQRLALVEPPDQDGEVTR